MRTRVCPDCGKSNRIPPEHLADTGRCGACGGPLPPVDVPLDVGAAELDAIVRAARVPVLIDFWAEWCAPCRMAAPAVKNVARAMRGRAIVLKVDTEREPGLAARFHVRGIPMFVVMKSGQAVFQQAGLAGEAQLRSWIEEAAAR